MHFSTARTHPLLHYCVDLNCVFTTPWYWNVYFLCPRNVNFTHDVIFQVEKLQYFERCSGSTCDNNEIRRDFGSCFSKKKSHSRKSYLFQYPLLYYCCCNTQKHTWTKENLTKIYIQIFYPLTFFCYFEHYNSMYIQRRNLPLFCKQCIQSTSGVFLISRKHSIINSAHLVCVLCWEAFC